MKKRRDDYLVIIILLGIIGFGVYAIACAYIVELIYKIGGVG